MIYAVLDPNCVQAIKKLLVARKKFQGLQNNDYVFGVLGDKNSYMNGSVTIKQMAMKAEVEPVAAFTAANLRKYISTDMIWMNLNEHQKRL